MICVLLLLPEDFDENCPRAPEYAPVPPVTGRRIVLSSSIVGPIAVMLPPVSAKFASQVASSAKLNVQE